MAMSAGYFEVSINFIVENRREKIIILINVLYPIYRMLIRSQNLLCFLRQLLMCFLNRLKTLRWDLTKPVSIGSM